MKLSQFTQISLSLLNFTQMILILSTLEESSYSSPDISKCTKISVEVLYIAQVWTKLFEVAHNEMKLLQIQNVIWLVDFTQMLPINLNVFIFPQIWMKGFSFALV